MKIQSFYFFFCQFLFLSEEKENRRKKKKQVRPHRFISCFQTSVLCNNVQCIHFYKNARPRFAFSGCLTRKSPKVCYVRRKNGCKNQADRSVRKADSAGRLDCYVSSNKAMGIGFQRKGEKSQSPLSFGRPFGSFPTNRKGT